MLPAGSLEAEFLGFQATGRQHPGVPRLPGYRPTTPWVHYTTSCNTQSGAPEDGRVQSPKHVELIGIINKPLLLSLVGVYIIYYNVNHSNIQLLLPHMTKQLKMYKAKHKELTVSCIISWRTNRTNN